MVLHIRRATTGDAPALADLTTQLAYPVGAPELAEPLARLLEHSASAILVAADEDDRVVGWLHVELHASLTTPSTVHIAGLVVDERHRSQGIGRELLTRVSAGFYEREGYRIVERSYFFERDLSCGAPETHRSILFVRRSAASWSSSCPSLII